MKKHLLSLSLIVGSVLSVNSQTLTASYDFSGNATDLVTGLTGTVTGATLVSDRNGTPNSAYSFSGSSNISIPTSNIMTNLYTYEAWVKLNTHLSGGSKAGILSIGDVTNSADQALCIANGNSGQLGFTHTAYSTTMAVTPSNAVQGNYSITLGSWYYVVATKTIDTVRLYVNGTLVAKTKFNGTSACFGSVSSPKATIGSRSNNAQYFTGVIDDVRIYDYAKTSSQIASDASAVGINELKEEAITAAFPMPFHNDLNIDSKYDMNYNIVNTLGQKVAEGKLEKKSNTIDLSMLQNGVYFIVTEKGSRKIIKE